MTTIELRHFHLFVGLGGGARGFNRASPRVGNLQGRFRCIGGIDVDPSAVRDFERLADTKGTVLDLFDRDQFMDFHGHEPGPDWREATPADIQRAAGGERPHIVFLSAPCKGFSGLLSEGKSKTDKYQALNRLTVRGVWLMLEAFADDPPELIIFENVPRIATRGRHLLDQIGDLLRAYGYAVAETTHDCGEIGGLAQSRKRFLLVARHAEKVQPFLYQPDTKPLRAVGDVLGRMPMPGADVAGPMHRVPRLQWKTWVRLAFVEAGSDWRSLNRLEVVGGNLRDFLIVPEYRNGFLGVNRWTDPMGAVAGESLPTNGKFSVADPRHTGPAKHCNEYRIVPWQGPAGAVTSAHGSGQCVADPRPATTGKLFTKYPVSQWTGNTGTVIGGDDMGAYAVADPRREGPTFGKYAVTSFDQPAGTVISGSTTGQGAYAVADPRPGLDRGKGDHYLTCGHYGVVPWTEPTGAVSASAGHDNGRWSVADPRLPAPADKLDAVIWSLDGTRHRPFTTLELAALQSLIDPEDTWVPWQLQGENDQDWRERIGNAVPSAAATAIAEVMGETLLLAHAGETFQLSARPVWVRPVALALSVRSNP